MHLMAKISHGSSKPVTSLQNAPPQMSDQALNIPLDIIKVQIKHEKSERIFKLEFKGYLQEIIAEVLIL